MGRVRGAGSDSGMVDALFLDVVAREAGDNGDVTEGDGELVGDDAGDAAVAVEEGMDTDETIVEVGEEAADFVDIGGFDVFDAIGEAASKGVELVVNFGTAAGNVMKVFIPWRAEANVVTARS